MCVSRAQFCIKWNTFPKLSPPPSHYHHLSVLSFPISTHKTNNVYIFHLIPHHFPFHFTFRIYGSMNCSRPDPLFALLVSDGGGYRKWKYNTVWKYTRIYVLTFTLAFCTHVCTPTPHRYI